MSEPRLLKPIQSGAVGKKKQIEKKKAFSRPAKNLEKVCGDGGQCRCGIHFAGSHGSCCDFSFFLLFFSEHVASTESRVSEGEERNKSGLSGDVCGEVGRRAQV